MCAAHDTILSCGALACAVLQAQLYTALPPLTTWPLMKVSQASLRPMISLCAGIHVKPSAFKNGEHNECGTHAHEKGDARD